MKALDLIPYVNCLVGHAEETIIGYQDENVIDLLLMEAYGHSSRPCK